MFIFLIFALTLAEKQAMKQAYSVDEVLNYLSEATVAQNQDRYINVVGWQNTWQYEMRTAISKYLFEDISITENIAPAGNVNRPGVTYEKKYVCVHDTGDAEYTAKQWSDVVYNAWNPQSNSQYTASFQYVIDENDVYHNIPDNENAYHAGDGSRQYTEIYTGVAGTNAHPEVTISSDGYYQIDGTKTSVAAPLKNGLTPSTSDLNDCGVRVVLRNGMYYLGNTWWSSSFGKIANYGGNCNSIGIETCINEGSEVFYTWQRLAKLVAKLLIENGLTVDDVQPHHFFSGKNCPQTMREAGMWDYFKEMIDVEYHVKQFINAGYSVSFKSHVTDYVDNSGRVIKTPSSMKDVSYTITVTSSSGETKSTMLYSQIMPLSS